MRLNELLTLRAKLLEVIQKYEDQNVTLPNCVDDLKNFLRLLDMQEFETLVGEDPDVPCWKFVLDGGFDKFQDLKRAFEEFQAEILGFRP